MPRTRDAVAIAQDFWNCRFAIHVLVRIGRPAEALAVLEAIGFVWSDDGFALYDLYFAAVSVAFPGMVQAGDAVMHRLLLYVTSPQTVALDTEARGSRL